LPSHPHEGAVGIPLALTNYARVVAQGRSKVTGARFNLTIAVEEPGVGRVIADSSFHHICDYNWNSRLGAPSFVEEPPGDAVLYNPTAMSDTRFYVENIAAWLSRKL
jgi:hypothetical protein